MKTQYTSALVMLAGIATGAIAVQSLHAQATPKAYTIAEIDISDLDAYQKNYVPLVQASIRAAGGRSIAVGQNIVTLEGEAPKTRVTINQFDSLESIKIWRNSEQYKDARKIGDKYAKFRVFAFEALPQ